MHFVAHTSITINGKLLKTAISIKSYNDGHAIGTECDIEVPLICAVQYKDGLHDYLTQYTASAQILFSVGDPVTIVCSYDNYNPITIFNGFIYDFVEGQPMTIKCLDYAYFFNLGIFGSSRVLVKKNKKSSKTYASVGTSYTSIKFKDLLQNLIDFVNDTIDDKTDDTDHVTLYSPSTIPDITFQNLTFAMMSPAAILEWFKKEVGFNIHLFGNQLYANVASFTTDTVTYNTSRNVIKSNLQTGVAAFQTFKVKAWFIRENGTKDSIEVGDSSGQVREVYFYKIPDTSKDLALANEALTKAKHLQYSGTITTMLYPFPTLFSKALFTSIRYPSQNGSYVITGIQTTIDHSGYRNNLKMAYLSDINTTA